MPVGKSFARAFSIALPLRFHCLTQPSAAAVCCRPFVRIRSCKTSSGRDTDTDFRRTPQPHSSRPAETPFPLATASQTPPVPAPPTNPQQPPFPPITTLNGNSPMASVSNMRVDYSDTAILDDLSSVQTSRTTTATGDDGTERDAPHIDPIQLFANWIQDAVDAGEREPNAMCLATVSVDDCRPSARIVLLRSYDQAGFVWYTNYQSSKAQHLASNPAAALTFWWPTLERSVRIEGVTSRVSEQESDAYFASRPAMSRLGAWASNQSKPVLSRQPLEDRFLELKTEYIDPQGNLLKDIPRPPHWGGFRLVPDRIEFWKGRAARIHDRFLFQREPGKDDGGWSITRLQP